MNFTNKALFPRVPLGGADILSSILFYGPPWVSLNGSDCVAVEGVWQAQAKSNKPRLNCVLKKKNNY